jgi:hypothetical protein
MDSEELIHLVAIFKKLFILSIVFSLIIPQKVYNFTEEEVKSLFSSIKELERQDSLNNELIVNLENQLKNSEVITKNDSLIIIELETQLKLKDDLIKEVTPKWYENKYLWFGYGVSAILIPIWVIGQIK